MTQRRVRLELDERKARALHAALSETIARELLTGDRLAATREILDGLADKVPGWLDVAPVGGEAGYLIAAEAVLRALVAAEERGLTALGEPELQRELGDAKPLGSTASDVLQRMRREKLISHAYGDRELYRAEPAGRRHTGWFLFEVDAAAYEQDPGRVVGWVGDGWPLDVDGIDVDELLALRHDRTAMLERAERVAATTGDAAARKALEQAVREHAVEAARAATTDKRTPDTPR
jgi:hypothetical protein